MSGNLDTPFEDHSFPEENQQSLDSLPTIQNLEFPAAANDSPAGEVDTATGSASYCTLDTHDDNSNVESASYCTLDTHDDNSNVESASYCTLDTHDDNIAEGADEDFDEEKSDENSDAVDDHTGQLFDKHRQAASQQEYHRVLPGQQLTKIEARKLCYLIDPEAFPNKKVSRRTTKRILEKVHNGGAALDNTEARYLLDQARGEDPADPAILTTQELAAVIAIQNGEKITCSRQVVESALKKIASGNFVDFGKQEPENKPIPQDDLEQQYPTLPPKTFIQRVSNYVFGPPSENDYSIAHACTLM